MDLSTLMPQQREIVTTLDRPLFVSAGAGSGKTFTLTRRILWALSPESGPDGRRLLDLNHSRHVLAYPAHPCS